VIARTQRREDLTPGPLAAPGTTPSPLAERENGRRPGGEVGARVGWPADNELTLK